MKELADLSSLSEAQRIALIGHRVVEHKERIAFLVENDEKADRYMEKIKARFPSVIEIKRARMFGSVFIQIGERPN